MLMLSGLGADLTIQPSVTTSFTTAFLSKEALLQAVTAKATPMIQAQLEPVAIAAVTETIADTIKQLQCLLNVTMQMPIIREKFASWADNDREGYALVQRWSPLDVDGMIKTDDTWIPRRESDTYALLSRTGISQFWMGDVYGYGPTWISANLGTLNKTLSDFVGPNAAAACDFPAQRAAAVAAAAEQARQAAEAAATAAAAAQAAQQSAAAAAAAAAAQKAAEEAALLEHQQAVQQAVTDHITASPVPTAPGSSDAPVSPGMQMTPATAQPGAQTSPLPAVSAPKPFPWLLVGGVALGAGILAAVLTKQR